MLPLPSTSSTKSSAVSSETHQEKVYTCTFNLLNTRQYTIPFDLSVSDTSFLSVQPTTETVLTPQSKVFVQCQFHLTQEFIDRFYTSKLHENEALVSKVKETTTIEHGRRLQWREQIIVKYNQNETEQMIPVDIRLYFPILTVNYDRIDFGKCFIDQTRHKEIILKNLTCSSSAWSIRKGNSYVIYLCSKMKGTYFNLNLNEFDFVKEKPYRLIIYKNGF